MDILYAVDDGNLTVIALLDLSTTFDTVDHNILLTWLKVSFSISGAALDWFQFYLTSRVECMRRSLARSTQKIVRFGMPQGSVLGPLLFILYTAGLLTLSRDMVFTLICMLTTCRYRAFIALGLPTSSSPPCQLT